jgi:hypothetical protein
MIDKNSKEYKQGLIDGINLTTKHIIGTINSFKTDIINIIKLIDVNTQKKEK